MWINVNDNIDSENRYILEDYDTWWADINSNQWLFTGQRDVRNIESVLGRPVVSEMRIQYRWQPGLIVVYLGNLRETYGLSLRTLLGKLRLKIQLQKKLLTKRSITMTDSRTIATYHLHGYKREFNTYTCAIKDKSHIFFYCKTLAQNWQFV